MLEFRPATHDDVELLYRWANDLQVRKNSFSTDVITFSEHREWFDKKLKSEKCEIFIFTLDSKPVGQVRFEISQDNTAEIGILINKEFRGKGLASDMLRLASEFAVTKLGIRCIWSHIKLDNDISVRAFEKAGYQNKKTIFFKNQKCFELQFGDPLL